MNQLSVLWHDIPPEAWVAIFGAGGVSFITQMLKKWAKLENDKVIQVLFAAVAFAAAALQYLVNAQNLPATVLGLHTAVLVGIGSQWYTHIVKPSSDFIEKVKSFDASQAAAELNSTTGSNNQHAEVNVPSTQADF